MLIAALVPFARQQKVSIDYQANFNIDDFYTESLSQERAMIISDNDTARREKIAAINNAKDRIIFSTYRFRADEAGLDFTSAIMAAADRGVKVDIITDGSCLLNEKESKDYMKLIGSHENIDLRIYNPIKFLKPWTFMGRLHDKYIIVDEDVLFLGGRNIMNRFNLINYEGTNYDWDILIYFEKRAEGDSMAQLENYFDNIFNYKYTESITECLSAIKAYEAAKMREVLAKNFIEMEREDGEIFAAQDYASKTIPIKNSKISYNPINISNKEPWCFYDMTQLMKSAEKSVYIHTPYFIGNDFMYSEIKDISEKVPTTIFLNAVKKGSNTFGNVEYYKKRDDIKAIGVRLLELDNNYPYHGKVFSIDDDLIGIGSFNLDMRSVYIDTELMMVVHGEEINQEMRKHMLAYEEVATEYKADGSLKTPHGHVAKAYTLGDRIKLAFMSVVLCPVRFLL